MTDHRDVPHHEHSVLDHLRTDVVRLRAADTVEAALARVRSSPAEGRIVYFYVVDEAERLVGVVPTRRLLLSEPGAVVADFMQRNVVALPAQATLLDACDFFIMHRLLSLPVIDAAGRLLGVVDVELYTNEVSELAARQESDDVFQLIGVRLAQVRRATIPAAYRGRFPWLLCNVGGGLLCALLAGLFEGVLAQVVVLAMFLPVVLALAESVSIQSLTLTLQSHEAGRFEWRRALGALRREAAIGLLLGLSCGGLVALAAWLWQGRLLVGWCMLLSIAAAVTAGSLFGLSVPTVLRAARRDPKAAAGPIVLAMTDIATLAVYLGIATAVFAPE